MALSCVTSNANGALFGSLAHNSLRGCENHILLVDCDCVCSAWDKSVQSCLNIHGEAPSLSESKALRHLHVLTYRKQV